MTSFRKETRLALSLGLLLGACVSRAPAARGPESGPGVGHIDAELEVRQISESAFLVTDQPFFSANVLVVRMPDGTVVVCSSPMETQATRALVGWISGTLTPSRIVAINTHVHFDGTGGNEAYRQLGVETYGSDLTQELLAKKGAAMKLELAKDLEDDEKARRVLAMTVTPAEHTFSAHDGMTLSFGGEVVRVVYPGPAHSPDNVVVYFPARALLFGGCMIKSGQSIGYVGNASLEHWPAAVDAVRGLGARVVVPGHGPMGGPELFDLTASLVRQARSRVVE